MTPLTGMAIAAAFATIAVVWHRLFFVHVGPITVLDVAPRRPRLPWLRGTAPAPTLLLRERQNRLEEVLRHY